MSSKKAKSVLTIVTVSGAQIKLSSVDSKQTLENALRHAKATEDFWQIATTTQDENVSNETLFFNPNHLALAGIADYKESLIARPNDGIITIGDGSGKPPRQM